MISRLLNTLAGNSRGNRALILALYSALALLWVCVVIALYLVKRDLLFIDRWLSEMDSKSAWQYKLYLVLYWLGQLFCPLGLLSGLRALQTRIRSRKNFGALVGIVAGLWCSSLAVSLPVIGIFLNLPALGLVQLLSVGTIAKSKLFLGIIGVNGFFGAAAGYVLGPYLFRRPRFPGKCVHCGYDLTGNTSGVCPECGCAMTTT